MKTLHLSIIAIAILCTCLILTFHLVSAQTIPTIKPGFLPDCMGQSFRPNESFDIINSTGFLGMHYLYYGHILVYDYILKPGQNATMLYAEHGGSFSDIAGDFQFFHGNKDGSHSGVTTQKTMINTTANSAFSEITISTKQDAEQGTYWIIFPPGLCSGGSVILFTIGNSLDLVPQTGTLKAHIENHETDDVVVINSAPYMLANLTLLDPAGKVEQAYEIMVDPNGNSARWFTPTQNGHYTAVITSAVGNMTIPFTVSGVEEPPPRVGNSINLHDSPLKQFKSGIKAEDVKCDSDFILVINRNYSPACVKESTGTELLLRGWAIGFPHYEAVYFMKPNTTAHVYVNYFPNRYGEGSNPPDLLIHLYSRIYKLDSSFPTNEINATAMPDLIHTNSNTVVDYTVTAPDTKGVYWLSLSNQCVVIPIAIGIDSSNLTTSDLQNPSESMSCPPPETQFNVANVSNVDLKLIRID